ncbi:MAG: carbohydrate porin [Bdellovibrionales bacterium]|nr:carbohydrate porin [Bdellovibrionales bacterium]
MQDHVDSTKNSEKNSGVYGMVSYGLSKDVFLFLKYGFASHQTNTFESGVETGFSYKGIFSSRPQDVLTMGYAQANTSSEYKRINSSTDYESVGELAYRVDVCDGISVTPDVQYIQNVGLSKTVEDAQVGTIRIEIEF